MSDSEWPASDGEWPTMVTDWPAMDAQRAFLDGARRATRQTATTQQRFARAFAHAAPDQQAAQREATAALVSALALPVAARATVEDDASLARTADAYRDALAAMENVTDDWWATTYRNATDAAETYDGVVGASADFADAWFEALASTADWADAMNRLPPTEESEPVVIDIEGDADE